MPILGTASSDGHVTPSAPRTLSTSGGCQANGQNPQYTISWLHPTTVPKWDGVSDPTLTTGLQYTQQIYLTSNNSLVGTLTGNTINSTGGSATTAGITLTAGTSYFFRVTASSYGFTISTDGTSFTALTAPGVVGTVTPVASSGQVVLSWAAVNGGGETPSYNIKIYTSGNVLFSTDVTTSTTLTKTGLTNGTTYYAQVYAYNSCGQTATSQSVTFTPIATPNFPTPNFPTPNFPTPNFPVTPNFPTPNFPTPSFPTPNFSPSFPTPNFPTPSFPTPNFPTPNFPTPNFPTPNFPTPNFPTPNFPTSLGGQPCQCSYSCSSCPGCCPYTCYRNGTTNAQGVCGCASGYFC